jgi:tRNA A37 methylthiotransferase MiaB
MKRGGTPEVFLRLIEKARATVPGIVLRTSFIVGFPGETEEDFKQLCDFVRRRRSTGWASSPTRTKRAQRRSNWMRR